MYKGRYGNLRILIMLIKENIITKIYRVRSSDIINKEIVRIKNKISLISL